MKHLPNQKWEVTVNYAEETLDCTGKQLDSVLDCSTFPLDMELIKIAGKDTSGRGGGYGERFNLGHSGALQGHVRNEGRISDRRIG